MSQQELQQLLEDIREIKQALQGSSKWGRSGLIEDVKGLKLWQQQVKLRIAFYSGAGTVLGLLLSKLAEYLTQHKI